MTRFLSYIESNIYSRGFRQLFFMRTAAAIAAGLLLLSTVAIGQNQSAQTVANPRAGAAARDPVGGGALPPDIMQLRREGHEALYNLDHATAVEKFEEIRNRMPQHPAGDLYLATAIWLRQLSKTRRLQTGLYSSGSSFYAGAGKEESEGDAIDPAVDRAFRERMAQARTKAMALVAKNRNDPDALYYLGSYYGIMAGY